MHPAYFKYRAEMARRVERVWLPKEQAIPAVEEAVREQLKKGQFPKLRATANVVQLPPRTLLYYLDLFGTTFKKIRNRILQDVALEHLDMDSKSIAEASAACCYKNPSAFTRAFKSWLGKTPSEYQRYMSESRRLQVE